MLPLSALRDQDVLAPILETVLDAVVVMDSLGVIVGWNDEAERTLGWSQTEALGKSLEDLIVPEQHRAAHGAGIRRMSAGAAPRVLNRRIEITAVHKDGHEVPVELAITRALAGDDTVYIGFLRDISTRRAAAAKLARQAAETRLMFEIATMASEASSFELALETTLRAICEISGWPVGHAFVAPDPGHRLVTTSVWVEDRPGRADALRAATLEHSFVSGVGMPGTILSTGEPAWVADIDADANFPRKGLGFRGAFGFPLKVEGNILAILEFFSESPQEPDPELLLTVRALGEQIGRVFERKRTEDRQRLLLGELNHRAKNTLAVVQGIAHQSFRSAATIEEAEKAFTSRLAAVAAAHELLAAERWTKASMTEIVKAAVEGCGAPSDRFSIRGHDFNVRPETAVSIALAVHELCTNAFKYGALSSSAGHVDIAWKLTGDTPPQFMFEWTESGGPEVSVPARKGFGTNLLQRGLGSELGGRIDMDFRREGLHMTFVAPLPGSQQTASD